MSDTLVYPTTKRILIRLVGFFAVVLVASLILSHSLSMYDAYDCFVGNVTYESASPDGKHFLEIVTKQQNIAQEMEADVFEISDEKTEKTKVRLFSFYVSPLQSLQWSENTANLFGIYGMESPDYAAIEKSGITFKEVTIETRPWPKIQKSARGYEISRTKNSGWTLLSQFFSSCI